MSYNTFRKIFSPVLLQKPFSLSVCWTGVVAKAWSQKQEVGYSVGVVATGLRMGVSRSLIGHIGEMALWL